MKAKEFFKTCLVKEVLCKNIEMSYFYFDDICKMAEAYHKHEAESEQSEKDVLFKILYEMRVDINELKKTVNERN